MCNELGAYLLEYTGFALADIPGGLAGAEAKMCKDVRFQRGLAKPTHDSCWAYFIPVEWGRPDIPLPRGNL